MQGLQHLGLFSQAFPHSSNVAGKQAAESQADISIMSYCSDNGAICDSLDDRYPDCVCWCLTLLISTVAQGNLSLLEMQGATILNP